MNSQISYQFWNMLLFTINKYQIEDILLTLDNASCHCSLVVKERLKQLGFNVEYLPPYTPTLAPVETLFKVIKSKIRASNEYLDVGFSKETGINFIYKVLKELDVIKLSTIWRQFIQNIFKSYFQSKY